MLSTRGGRLGALIAHERSLEGVLFVTQVLLVVSSVVLARAVGAEGRGAIATVTVYGQLVGWTFCFSLDKAFLVLSRESDADVMATFRTTLAMAHVLVVPTAIVGFLAGEILLDRWEYSVAMAAIAVGSLYSEMYAAWLLATDRERFLVFRVAQPLFYFGAALGVAALVEGADTRTRVFVLVAACAAGAPSLVGRVLVRFPPAVWGVRGQMQRRLVRFAAAAQSANALQYVNSKLDVLYLATTGQAAAVGVYAVGASIGQATMFLGTAGILRGVTGRDRGIDWAGVGGVAAAAVAIGVTAPFVVPRVFGSEFEGAVVVAQFLAAGAVLNFGLQSLAGKLLGHGRPAMVAWVQGVGIPAFALGIFVSDSLKGVAVASVVSYGVSLVAAVLATRHLAEPAHASAPVSATK
jgi:O-antigen/teichoic acid export membrane protein